MIKRGTVTAPIALGDKVDKSYVPIVSPPHVTFEIIIMLVLLLGGRNKYGVAELSKRTHSQGGLLYRNKIHILIMFMRR